MTKQPPYKNNLGRDPETKRWHVRKVVSGRVVHRSFSQKQTAERFLSHLELMSAGVRQVDLAPTVEEAIDLFVTSRRRLGRSENTLDYYSKAFKAIRLRFGDRPLDSITQREIDEFVDGLLKTLGQSTINKRMKDLKRLYRYTRTELPWRFEAHTASPRERWVRPPADVAGLWIKVKPATRCAVGLSLLAGLRAAEV